MTLPLQVRSYTTDLYTQALSSIWTFYDRVRDPAYALAQDVDAWEVMRRDPKIYQGTTERLHAVAGPSWRVFPFNNSRDPADALLAKVCEDALRRIPHLADARLRLAQTVFRGQASELIVGKRQVLDLGGIGKQNWWVPTGLKNVDARRFTVRPIRTAREDGTTRVRGELYMSTVPMQGHGNAGAPSAGPRPDSAASSGFLTYYRKVEHPEWFIRTIYNDEEARLGYGHGALDALYFYSWVKTVLLREGLQGVERWSQGIVHGKIDESRVGAIGQDMESERAAMLDTLTKMRSRGVIVTGKMDEVEVHTGGGEGHQIVMAMLDYIDDCIMAVCTGAVLMSSKSNAGSLGSLSRDEIGRDTQRGVIAFDKNKIDEDISLDLIGLFLRTNRRTLVKLGIAGAGVPQFRTIGAKTKDPDKFAGRITAIVQASPDGFKMRKDELFEGLDLTPPSTDDETVMIGGPGKVALQQIALQAQAQKQQMGMQQAQMEMDAAGRQHEQGMAERKHVDETSARDQDREAKREETAKAGAGGALMRSERQDAREREDARLRLVEGDIRRLADREPAAPMTLVYQEQAPVPAPVAISAPQPITITLPERKYEMSLPQVNVAAPNVTVEPAVVNVTSPTVTVGAPMANFKADVHVPAPAAPVVHVDVPGGKDIAKSLDKIRDMVKDFFGSLFGRKKVTTIVERDKEGRVKTYEEREK